MKQTTLSVALEVKSESYEHLSSLLDKLHGKHDKAGSFAEFLTGITSLHFLSLSLFPGYDYDSLFVIEANFDGEPGPFWAQLEAAIGADLRRYLACCKQPLDEDGPLFDAVTAPDSRAPIAPYLEARSLRPTTYHHGNRGMTRDRILSEFALFNAMRSELEANDAMYRQLEPAGIHRTLREAMVEKFSWLNKPAPKRISFWENIGDLLRFTAFIFGALFVLSVPGLILALAAQPIRSIVLLVIVFAGLFAWLWRIAGPLPGTDTSADFSIFWFLVERWRLLVGLIVGLLFFNALYVAVATAIFTPVSMLLTGNDAANSWPQVIKWLGIGVLSEPVTAIGLLVWLRTVERRDSAHDAPLVDPKLLSEMARLEDWIPQNHMGSIVLIKPGILRAILIRVGHLGLGLLLRLTARSGYLGSMRTIHFAHWAMVNNKSRLMFLSNFDQTWESYLDDFIEKAHPGLTFAWSCGVGFPPARFLIYGGASRGRNFKEWARHSMAISHFWYSAYKDLTTNQIERNFRIATGFRKPTLSEKEATQWINDL
jgi:hypothetical protein